VLKFLVRCTLFIVGVVFILDIGLPIRTEQNQVDQHTSQTQTDHRQTRTGDSRWADTSYKIHLVGGSFSSCSVGYSAYATLKDGDSVEVQSTRLFKTCIRISRGTDVIEVDKHWKLFALAFGGVLIAIGLGWLKNDDDDDRNGLGIRLG
jgi:hypothetical protein